MTCGNGAHRVSTRNPPTVCLVEGCLGAPDEDPMFPEIVGGEEGDASCSGARPLPLSGRGDIGSGCEYPGMESSSKSSSSS